MKQVNENSVLSEIMAVADTTMLVDTGNGVYHAIVVEGASDNGVEGTYLYFPGIFAKDLL